MSQLQRIKEIIKQYGKFALYTHIGLSIFFYTAAYMALSYKYVNANKLFELCRIPIPEDKLKKAGTDAFLAYVIYKSTLPVRISITAVPVPLLVKLLKRK